MKIYEAYKNLLTETKVEACIKNFGHELFGHELGGTEKNTGIENNYLRDIHDFTDNQYGEETSQEFIKALKGLKGCMQQYPEVLIPEKTRVFRGLTIPVKYFIDRKTPISLKNSNPYTYKASNPIQSWSTSFDAASVFGNHDTVNEISRGIDFQDYNTPEARRQLLQEMVSEDLRIAFVLQYESNAKEFIFKSKYFRVLSQATHEDELIRMDNNPIQVQAWFNEHEDVFLTHKSLLLIKYINKAISEL